MLAQADSLITIESPIPRRAWDEIYSADPQALPDQSARWASALVDAGYRDVGRLYSFGNGVRVAVPLFETGGPRLLRRWWSPPKAWGFGGAIADRAPGVAELSAILDDIAANAPLQVCLRPNPLQAALWDSAAHGRWITRPMSAHVLDLTGGFDVVWSKRFRRQTRARVRKAKSLGVEIRSGNSAELIQIFHDLLALSFERWAERQHEPHALTRLRGNRRDPVSKFHRMAKAMGSSLIVRIAMYHGEPAAGLVVLQDKNTHCTRGAMNKDLAAPTSANFLLHQVAIEAACQQGCLSYHMGETGQSQSLAQFKSRFGAVATPYPALLFERVPLSVIDRTARTIVKRAIGFRDA